MSNYVLESDAEFDRLERQSAQDAYNFEKEILDLKILPGDHVLDAGCGSGIVTRLLGGRFPEAHVIGCDFSETRILQARKAAQGLSNVTFDVQNLRDLSYPENSFDTIICRYVIEHLPMGTPEKVFQNFQRCLKPEGRLHIIDIDGVLYNVYPTTPHMDVSLEVIQKDQSIDLYIGRKLPFLLGQAGFEEIDWRIDTLHFSKENMNPEATLMRERFESILPYLCRVIGNEKDARRFIEEYMNSLNTPQAVLFYNKFIVSAKKRKSAFRLLKT